MTLPKRFLRKTLAAVMFLGALSALAPLASSQPAQRFRVGEPRPATCADDCTRRAAACLDGCEEKFKDDDKGRVTCKFECATKRQQCERDCG